MPGQKQRFKKANLAGWVTTLEQDREKKQWDGKEDKRKEKEKQKDEGIQTGEANRERKTYLGRRKKMGVKLMQIHLFGKGNPDM